MDTTNLNTLLNSVNHYYAQNNAEIDIKYIEQLLKETEDFPIISFDIFDTVLTRLFECPIDLFACVEGILIEKNISLPDFAKNRLIAEETSRKYYAATEFQEEVTLDNIYSELLLFYAGLENELNLAKNIELNTEKSSIIPVIDNFYLIKKLQEQNKIIYFVSDTYFSKQFIEELLQQSGISDYGKLFASSEIMKTKHSGRIWEEVLKHSGNKKIFHIGDNLHADVIQPKKYNIQTYHYSRLFGERRLGAQLTPSLVPFSLLQKLNILSQKINSDIKDEESNFWINLGSTFGAVILQSFISWLSQQINKYKIEHIFFCARDAQVIQKVWDLLEMDNKHQTTSSYLYLSRHTLWYPTFYIELATDNRLSASSLDLIVNGSVTKGDTYETYFQRIGIDTNILAKTNFKKKFGSLTQKFDFNKINEIKDFIQNKLSHYLLKIYYDQYDKTISYCKQEGLFNSEKRIAIIDLGWNGTVQTALTKFRLYQGVKKKLYGFYYGFFNRSVPGCLFNNGIMKSAFFKLFQQREEECLLENTLNILENLHSADHQTTKSFSKNSATDKYIPILKPDTDSSYINNFNRTINLFQQSALQSILHWAKKESIYGISSEWINTSVAKAAILQVCITPNHSERKYLGKIQHSTLNDHKKYYPLITTEIPTESKDVTRLLLQGGWPCGVIRYWNENKKQIKPEIYNKVIRFFDQYPELIKQYLVV